MDAERQPLLYRPRDGTSDLRSRKFRPLTREEVLNSRNEVPWKRARLVVLLVFWAILVAVISMAVSLLVRAPRCVAPSPVVPPVHLNLAPFLDWDDKDHVYEKDPIWMT